MKLNCTGDHIRLQTFLRCGAHDELRTTFEFAIIFGSSKNVCSRWLQPHLVVPDMYRFTSDRYTTVAP